MTIEELNILLGQKRRKRREILKALEDKVLDPSTFTQKECKSCYDKSHEKVFELLVEYGLDINFNKSLILKKAINEKEFIHANYLRVASKNEQTIDYPESLDYSLKNSIYSMDFEKVECLFSLPNYPTVANDIANHSSSIWNTRREQSQRERFYKLFNEICPDKIFSNYIISQICNCPDNLKNELLEKLYDRKETVLVDIENKDKESLTFEILNIKHRLDFGLLYKFVELQIITKEQYEEKLNATNFFTFTEEEVEFFKSKKISPFSKIDNISIDWIGFENAIECKIVPFLDESTISKFCDWFKNNQDKLDEEKRGKAWDLFFDVRETSLSWIKNNEDKYYANTFYNKDIFLELLFSIFIDNKDTKVFLNSKCKDYPNMNAFKCTPIVFTKAPYLYMSSNRNKMDFTKFKEYYHFFLINFLLQFPEYLTEYIEDKYDSFNDLIVDIVNNKKFIEKLPEKYKYLKNQ